MKTTAFHISRYDLPLTRPLVFGETEIKQRKGIIIALSADNGHVAYGEISPLPGFSQESLEEADKQVNELKSTILKKEIPEDFSEFAIFIDQMRLYPSVALGLEMALLNLNAQAQKKDIREIISPSTHDNVPICGLLQGSIDAVVKEAQQMIEAGFKEFKLKVGDGNINEDIKKVSSLSKIIENKALLRLDANQKWSINDAIAFGNEVGLAAVEYVEEPFKDVSKIEEFFTKTTIPVALDENLTKLTLKDIKSMTGVEVIILKPTMLGGITKTLSLMKEAEQYGLTTIISSSFETNLGIRTLAEIASCARVVHPAGLDTLKWFEDNIVDDYCSIENGQINLKKLAGNDIKLKNHYIS